jgi:membrane-associated phospholipid phosphatase
MSALLRRPFVATLGCWAAFWAVLVAAYWLPLARWADGWAVEGFLGLQRPWLDPWASRVAHMADPAQFVIVTLLLTSIALARGSMRRAAAVVFLLAGASVTSQILKLLLQHPRPHDFLGAAQLHAVAFPSGHATASMAIALAAIIVAPAALRPLVAVAGTLFTLAVSESILLLAWHFPSDVLGGYLVAASFACMALAGLGWADARWPERSGREAAKRALGRAAFGWSGAAVAAVVSGLATAAVVLGGERALRFADRHTTAVLAVTAVAALAAALPAAVAGMSARRV